MPVSVAKIRHFYWVIEDYRLKVWTRNCPGLLFIHGEFNEQQAKN